MQIQEIINAWAGYKLVKFGRFAHNDCLLYKTQRCGMVYRGIINLIIYLYIILLHLFFSYVL